MEVDYKPKFTAVAVYAAPAAMLYIIYRSLYFAGGVTS
jgi:hypothetical protein